MKDLLRNMRKGLLAFLLVVSLGFFLLFLVNLLPTGRIAFHVRESGSILNGEGDYWLITQGDLSAHLDNYTDAIMLLTAGYTGEESALEKTAHNYRLALKEGTWGESCMGCGILPDDQVKLGTYERYWQGFLIVLKPLLLFLNLSEIRSLNMVGILSCIVLICVLLSRRQKSAYIFPYILALCFMNLGTVLVSLQYSTIFYTTSIAMIGMLLFFDRKKFQENIWLFFLITGMCTSYFDFLTYPIVALAFPLTLFFLLSAQKKLLPAIGRLIGYSLLWGIGYSGMWASKWVIATLITGKNQFIKAFSKIRERSGHDVIDVPFTWTQMMHTMKDYLTNGSTLYLLTVFLLLLLILVVLTKGYRQKSHWITTFLLALISLYPFLWYTAAANHSMQHNFFTFKSMAAFLFAIGSCLIPLVDWNRFKKKLSQFALRTKL